jgi:hypothetical protein
LALVVAFPIGTAVALHTVVEVANAFISVLTQDVLHCVLMAAIAGVTAVVVVDMAGCAFHVVVLVQYERLLMVKRGGFPCSL